VGLGLLLVTSLASARVVMTPTVSRSCPGGADWSAVTKCLARFGRPQIVDTLGRARLVKMPDVATGGFRVPGVYLYEQTGKRWSLTGTLVGPGYEATGLANVTYGTRTGYRFDARRDASGAVVIGEHAVPARTKQTHAVLCFSGGPWCSVALLSCDVFVGGKSYYSFRGSLVWRDKRLHLDGDRSAAGPYCASQEEVYLPFDARDDQ